MLPDTSCVGFLVIVLLSGFIMKSVGGLMSIVNVCVMDTVFPAASLAMTVTELAPSLSKVTVVFHAPSWSTVTFLPCTVRKAPASVVPLTGRVSLL